MRTRAYCGHPTKLWPMLVLVPTVMTACDAVPTALSRTSPSLVAGTTTPPVGAAPSADRSSRSVQTTAYRVTVSPSWASLPAGDSFQLTAQALDSSGRVIGGAPVTWTALNTNVVSISAAGLTGARAPGLAIIRATSGGKTGSIVVVVTPRALRRVTLTPSVVTLDAAGVQQYTATGTWSDGSSTAANVTYAATGGSITASGRYTASSAPGVYRVIATTRDGAKSDTATVTVKSPPLRQFAGAKGIAIGSAVDMNALATDAQYRAMLATEYNSVVAEWVMKFAALHPASGVYNFGDADNLVQFAQANGMAVHGHTLVWHDALPDWIATGTFTKPQLLSVLKDHISTVVGRYRGRVQSWDVANEVVADDNTTLRNSIWMQVIGPEYLDSAFTWARRADPAAKLYINDYKIETVNAKSTKLLALAQSLRARGIPLDGVGFQFHLAGNPPSATDIQANFARFGKAGLLLRISEMDVALPNAADTTALYGQANVYRDVLDACLRQPGCTGLTTWGFTDKYSWIPTYEPGLGRGLPLDVGLGRKPAYDALLARLRTP